MRGAFAAILLVWAVAARADEYRTFEGHGGPVKAVHLSADGQTVLTASFDNSVGLWNVASDAAPRWLDGHRAAVNCVIDLPGGLARVGRRRFRRDLVGHPNGRGAQAVQRPSRQGHGACGHA